MSYFVIALVSKADHSQIHGFFSADDEDLVENATDALQFNQAEIHEEVDMCNSNWDIEDNLIFIAKQI